MVFFLLSVDGGCLIFAGVVKMEWKRMLDGWMKYIT